MNIKPSTWDWVTATNECNADTMFGTLHTLAQQNIETRNKQLGRNKFAATENAGMEFCVGHDTPDLNMKVWFARPNESDTIRVKFRDAVTTYTVRLDDTGHCKLWDEDGQPFDPWQVLKKATEPLLFKV